MSLPKKTMRYSMRLTPKILNRLKEISNEMNTSLPDLLTIGAMLLFHEAQNELGYLHKKSELLEKEELLK